MDGRAAKAMLVDGGKGRVLLACAAAYSMANVGWWVQPAIINEVITRLQVGELQAGLVASAEMSAIALSSMAIAMAFGRWSLRRIALSGVVVTLIGALLSALSDDYHSLLASRAIAGLGEGTLLAVATAALAGFREPDRAYGKINIVAILFGTLVFLSLPATGEILVESRNVFPTLLASVVLLAGVVPLLPPSVGPKAPQQRRPGRAPRRLTRELSCLALAVFIVGVTSGAMWSFYFLLGAHAGLNDAQIHTTVSLSALISVVGALLATVIGARFGRFIPVTLGILSLTVAIAAMAHWPHPLVFQIAACVNVAAMYFLVPYFLAYAAVQDPSGGDAAIVGGVFLLTGAVGPYFGGYVFERFSMDVMTALVVITNALAWGSFVLVERLQKTRLPSKDLRPASSGAALNESSR